MTRGPLARASCVLGITTKEEYLLYIRTSRKVRFRKTVQKRSRCTERRTCLGRVLSPKMALRMGIWLRLIFLERALRAKKN